MGGNSLQGVGAAGRGEECRQKRERSLERTTCHFKQFGLHPKVNMEATEQFCRVMEPDHSVLDGNKKRWSSLGSGGSESRQYLYFPAKQTNQG